MFMTMKRMILSLVAAVMAVSMAAQEPGEGPKAEKDRPQTNHTVSTTLGAGLEYGFEWAFAGKASVVARAGLVSKDWSLRNSLGNFEWSTSMVPGVTLEPRYYLLMDWRDRHGKYTTGNSAEFIGFPALATLRKDGKGLGEVVVTPVLGVRRAFARHWFHEFTAGADLLCYPRFFASAHVGYRIGFLF